ncbi:MAG: WD40/YVTN/BNR-like repeat-containing protein, partial [Chitinophagaceae bacterium]
MFFVSRFKAGGCWTSSLSILLIFSFSFSYGQMRQVYLDNLDEDNHVEKISFYTPNEGLVAFTKYIGYTIDSGKTFTKKYITINNVDYNGYLVNLTFGFGIKGVKAFNKDTVIVYGDYGFVPSILYSINGGNSFKLVYHAQFSQLYSSITDMHFEPSNNTGYAIDADRILKTINRGISWTVIRVDPESKFEFIEAINATNLVVFSENKVLKTSNAGVSWQPLPIPSS